MSRLLTEDGFVLLNEDGGALLIDEPVTYQTNAFVWLVNDASGPPSLPGAPPGAVHLRADENTFVTRADIAMRAFGSGFATNASVFASMPFQAFENTSFHGVIFELAAGAWEVGFIVITDGGSGGNVSLIDDPAGARTVRYTRNFPTSTLRANDTDGTIYTDQATAVADAAGNLTFVPVTVSDLGGGKGLLLINGSAPFILMSAVALRREATGGGAVSGSAAGTLALGGGGIGAATISANGAGALALGAAAAGTVSDPVPGGGGGGPQLVGSATALIPGSTAANTPVSLTGLTGGIASAPAPGDWVIVSFATASGIDRTLAVISAGYSQLVDLYIDAPASATTDTNLAIFAKRMDASADSEVILGPTGASLERGVAAVRVWRGGDPDTLLDVALVSASAAGTVRPDPAAITPQTSGAVIEVIGASADNGINYSVTNTELSSFVSARQSSRGINLGVGHLAWSGGTVDPAPFASSGDTATSSWIAVTLALKPAPSGPGAIAGQAALALAGGGTGSATVRAEGAGALALGGGGSAAARLSGAAVAGLRLAAGASGRARIGGQAAAAASLAGGGSGRARIAGQAAGGPRLGASGAAGARIAGTGTGALRLAGGGAGAARTLGAAAGSLGLGGAAAGTIRIAASGAGALQIAAAGAVTTAIAGAGAAGLTLGGAGSGGGFQRIIGSGAAGLSLGVAAAARARIGGQATVRIDFGSTGTGSATIAGTGAAALALSVSGAGGARLAGSGAPALSLGGGGAGGVSVIGQASAVLRLAGSGNGPAARRDAQRRFMVAPQPSRFAVAGAPISFPVPRQRVRFAVRRAE